VDCKADEPVYAVCGNVKIRNDETGFVWFVLPGRNDGVSCGQRKFSNIEEFGFALFIEKRQKFIITFKFYASCLAL